MKPGTSRRWTLVTILLACSTSASPLDLWGALKPGPHAVGFRLIEARATDLLPSLPGRAIEISLWYPARSGSARTMTFEDYFKISRDLRRRSAPKDVAPEDLPRVLSAAMSGDASGVAPEIIQRALAASLRGVRDAPAASGRFPVVMWSARYGTTAAQCVLSEFLASHGFLVAFARPREEQERLPFELETREARADQLEAQVRDLTGALHTVRALPEAAPEAVTVAWSYAGESAVRLARTDALIVGVIGLSTNTAAQWVYGAESLPSLEAGPLDIPFSILGEEAGPDGAGRDRRGNWSSFPAGSMHAVLPQLRHGSFNVVEGLLPAALNLTRVQPWSRAGKEQRVGYETLCRLVLAAVQAAFDRHDGAMARVAAGLDEGVARLDWKRGPWPRRTVPERVTVASADGLKLVAELYRAPSPSRPCLVLFHQSGSSRGEYRGIAPHLASRGYTSLAVDVRWGRQDRWNRVVNESARAVGAPEILAGGDAKRRDALSRAAVEDMRAAIAWLGARDECEAGVVPWGSSISANRVLELAASGTQGLKSVIAFSPGEYDQAKPEALRTVVRSLEVPTLIVWGRGESDLTPPILAAMPKERATGFGSTLGFHGSSILYDDPSSWPPVLAFLERLGRKEPLP